MTLSDIEALDKEFLSPEDVAAVLGADPQSIRNQVRINTALLGFPTIVLGARIRIPRDAFLFYCKFGNLVIEEAAIKWR